MTVHIFEINKLSVKEFQTSNAKIILEPGTVQECKIELF